MQDTYQILVIQQFAKVGDDWSQKIVVPLVLVDKDISNCRCNCGSLRAGSGVETGLEAPYQHKNTLSLGNHAHAVLASIS
jgi:hypothetical protein